MSDKTKAQFKQALIAALIGAAVTFLTQLLQWFTSIQITPTDSMVGGGASFAYYLRQGLKRFI